MKFLKIPLVRLLLIFAIAIPFICGVAALVACDDEDGSSWDWDGMYFHDESRLLDAFSLDVMGLLGRIVARIHPENYSSSIRQSLILHLEMHEKSPPGPFFPFTR